MKSLFTILGAVAILCAPVSNASAAAVEYEFDTVHSQIIFFVEHMGFAKSEGEFLDFDGGFTFDPENVEASKVDVTIDTKSLDMDDKVWTEHTLDKFFDVENHPDMTFKSTHIEKTSENMGKMTGDLTLLGVTKPVTLDVKLNKAAAHPRTGKPHAGFSATGEIKRSEWGMDTALPMIGDDIEIRIEIEAGQKTKEND